MPPNAIEPTELVTRRAYVHDFLSIEARGQLEAIKFPNRERKI